MILCHYAGIPFRVLSDEAVYPGVEPQSGAPPQWSATIRLAARADLDALLATRTAVDWQPVLYTNAWNGTNRNGGPGLAPLIVPSTTGVLTTYQAVCAEVSNIRLAGWLAGAINCDVTFTVPAL